MKDIYTREILQAISLLVALLMVTNAVIAQSVPNNGNEPPRALTGRGLDNLVAFTRLLGYVRHFHPSDEVAATDWNKFVINGVGIAEKAASSTELAMVLEKYFHSIAPTIRVFPTGQPPALPAELKPPKDDPSPKLVSWRHYGVGLSENSIYSSVRINNKESNTNEFGNLMQFVDATPYRGKRLRYRAAVRAEVNGVGNQAQLWLRVDRNGNQMGFFDNMDDRPIKANEWREYEIVGEIANDAQAIYLGCFLLGKGKALIADVSLEVIGDNGSVKVPLKNSDFSEGKIDEPPKAWMVAAPARFSIKLNEDSTRINKRCASIVGEELKFDFPDPAKPFIADLGGGISCMVPLALYADSKATIPRASAAEYPLTKQAGFIPSGDDRATRLAAVAIAWNIFQHFYPYFDVVKTDWSAVLRETLTAAATDTGQVAFLTTMRRMVAQLHDGHGGVYHRSDIRGFVPPFIWDWVENKLVVTYVAAEAATSLRPGDVILKVNGRSVAEIITEWEALISGATIQWKRYNALQRNILAGLEGSEINLEIQRQQGSPTVITLRRTIHFTKIKEPRPEKITEIRPGIFYLDLDRINDGDFNQVLTKLVDAKAVIFDLRGYPRDISTLPIQYLTDKPVRSARFLVPQVKLPDHQQMIFDDNSWELTPLQPRLKGKIAFIIDGRAISYAETYMGIIEHYKLAEIVGSPTAGTNGNINIFMAPGEYQIVWTGMKTLKQDGSQHHGIGIQPTVPVFRTMPGVVAGQDELLDRAIQVVSR
ncbi:MAG: S41 family peptidase [Acidobacteriota bacterium]